MKYTITFSEKDYDSLIQHLFCDRSTERAAYALCKLSENEDELRLLIREVIPVLEDDIEEATEVGMKIRPRSFLRAMKQADKTKQLFLFIHSHPEGFTNHSNQDDREEYELFKTAFTRIKTKGVHGSLVLSSPDKPKARIWLADGTTKPVDLIRVIGNKFRFYSDLGNIDPLPTFFDRQIRAFGNDIQKVLKILNIGIVGLGGTGSSISEQLIRLGVGTLSIFDGGTFEKTNVNRVYGSKVSDDGQKKVIIAECNSQNIGLQTNVISYDKPITFSSAIEKLKSCDVIFGCTDDNWGRSILNRLTVYYYIPVFDMGVKIDSQEGIIKSIQGRVTTLLGGYACLFCRERITAKKIESEMLAELDPRKLVELQKEGYADELENPAPSVIPFTTNIASLAISEFIHRLTGYMGADRETNEIIMKFDETKISRNNRISKEDCFCGDKYYLLRGDTNPLLDLTWRNEDDTH